MGEEPRKKRSHPLSIIIPLLALLFITVFEQSVQRYIWKLWSGTHTTWRGLTLPIAMDMFALSKGDDRGLVIGHFSQSEERFPVDNVLLLSHETEEAPIFFQRLEDVCKKKSCQDYSDQTSMVNGSVVRCVTMKAHFASWQGPDFHSFCRANGSDIRVDYHGNFASYEAKFKEMEEVALQTITQKKVP